MPKRKSSLGRSTKNAKRKKETRANEDENSYPQHWIKIGWLLVDKIIFYNSKNRHLKFLNLSPQGLISSNYNSCHLFS